MESIKATLGDKPKKHRGPRNYGVEKETIATKTLVVEYKGTLRSAVVVRWYMSRSGDGASPVYCSFWAHKDPHYPAGSGSAGSCGYHKPSAAFQDALDDAGVRLSWSIDGVGDNAVDAAMHAVADALGYRSKRRIIV